MILKYEANFLNVLNQADLARYGEESSIRSHTFKTSENTYTTTYNYKNGARIDKNDTSLKNNDTFKRLYKINNVYYYRRRINKKLFRISLKTDFIKTALMRKSFLDKLSNEEMFRLETKDYKLIFEYETEEELKIALENFYKLQIEKQVNNYRSVKNELEREVSSFTFEDLEKKYILKMKENKKVSESSLLAYKTTFNFLIDFFKDKYIDNISIDEFEEFQKHLMKDKKNKTVNKHINYLKKFMKFAKERNYIQCNHTDALIALDEKTDEIERKKTVENYSDEEILNILNFKYDDKRYNTIFKIAAYTGMRINEIFNIKNSDIKINDDILYIDVTKSKTKSGIRKIPIHNELIDIFNNNSFPIFKDISLNAFEKRVRARLYKVIKNNKNVHTIRATFIQKVLDHHMRSNDNITTILQEIVGHSKSSSVSLTQDVYAKEIDLKIKLDIVNSVKYNNVN